MNVRLRSPLWRRFVRAFGNRLFSWSENNGDARFNANGEKWLIHQLLAAHQQETPSRPFVLFDAGANRGDYTHAVIQHAEAISQKVEVHAFEPSAACVEALRYTFSRRPEVRVIDAAVSDRSGDGVLFGESGSTLASLVSRVGSDPGNAETAVRLLAMGDYIAAEGIMRVDLLKLDIEGSELAALHGLGEHLNPEVVDVIQFEYGGTTLDAGASLRDIYGSCVQRGYVVAKLFPSAVEVRTYKPWMEHYSYANYCALSPRWTKMRRSVE